MVSALWGHILFCSSLQKLTPPVLLADNIKTDTQQDEIGFGER
jgi:hypothetical protein